MTMAKQRSYNLDAIRGAWSAQYDAARKAARAAAATTADPYPEIPYAYVKEVWTDFVVVCVDGPGPKSERLAKVPYEVGDDGVVTFGTPTAVRQTYVELSAGSDMVWRETPAERLLRLTK